MTERKNGRNDNMTNITKSIKEEVVESHDWTLPEGTRRIEEGCVNGVLSVAYNSLTLMSCLTLLLFKCHIRSFY